MINVSWLPVVWWKASKMRRGKQCSTSEFQITYYEITFEKNSQRGKKASSKFARAENISRFQWRQQFVIYSEENFRKTKEFNDFQRGAWRLRNILITFQISPSYEMFYCVFLRSLLTRDSRELNPKLSFPITPLIFEKPSPLISIKISVSRILRCEIRYFTLK